MKLLPTHVLETLTVVIIMGMIPLWVFISFVPCMTFVGRCMFLIYCTWIYIDRHTPQLGGRRSERYRKLVFWKYFRSYFPAVLHKTVDLPENENFIFATFPHGVTCRGVHAVFGCDSGNMREQLSNVNIFIATLPVNFWLPIHREWVLATGCIDTSRRSLDYVLGGLSKNNAVVLAVGGAAEAENVTFQKYTIYLKKRFGFCKTALSNGASLVPVIVFGENDLYKIFKFPENSWMHAAQTLFKKITGVFPIFHLWFLPRKTPINIVVGEPIKVKKNVNPSDGEIKSLHATFEEKLVQLFNSEKYKYTQNPEDTHLTIL